MPTPEDLFAQSIEANRQLKDTVLQKSTEGAARETRMEQLHTTRLDQMQSTLNQESQNREAEVDTAITNFSSQYPLFRLTHNQKMLPNAEGTAPLNWWQGAGCTMELVEKVSGSVDPAARSALAQEFLIAVGQNRMYFATGFNIWRLRYNAAPSWISFPGTAIVASPHTSIGCVAKHESGDLINNGYLTGLEAGQPAKMLLTKSGSSPADYWHVHPISSAQTGSVLIALVAVVAGNVPSGFWHVFPSINNSPEPGMGTYE